MKMNIFILLIFSLLFFRCQTKKNKSLDFEYLVTSASEQGEFFDVYPFGDTLFVCGVRLVNDTWKANLLKISIDGDYIQNFYYDNYTVFHNIIPASDKDFYITGSINKDDTTEVLLALINKNGKLLFKKTYNYAMQGEGIKTVKTGNRLYILAMAFLRTIPPKIYLIKTDLKGNVIKEKIIRKGYKAKANDIATDGKNLFITGQIDSLGLSTNLFVAKLDSNLNIIWFNVINRMLIDRGDALCLTKNGDLYVAGTTQSKGNGLYDIWVLKINPQNGEIIKETTFGFKRNDWATSLICYNNNKLEVFGVITNDSNKINLAKLTFDKNLKLKKQNFYYLKKYNQPNNIRFSGKYFAGAGFYQKLKYEKFGWLFTTK